MAKDEFTKTWILENGLPIVEQYRGELTLRALHYRLVAKGMTNTMNHYRRVVTTMIGARKDGTIPYDAFLDHETLGETAAEQTDVHYEIDRALRDGLVRQLASG